MFWLSNRSLFRVFRQESLLGILCACNSRLKGVAERGELRRRKKENASQSRRGPPARWRDEPALGSFERKRKRAKNCFSCNSEDRTLSLLKLF